MERDGRATAWFAWFVAGGSVVAAAGAIAVAPEAAVPWTLVCIPVLVATPGALILGARPRHPVGWLFLVVGLCFAASAVASQWSASGRAGGAWASWWVDRGSAVLVPATVLTVLLLPDGRLPSPGWRPLAHAVVGAQVLAVLVWWFTPGTAPGATTPNPVGVLPEAWAPVVERLEWVLVAPFFLAAAAVVHRLLRRESTERRRLLGLLVAVLVFVLAITVPGVVAPDTSDWFNLLGSAVLAGAVLVAVLRGQVEQVRVVVSYTFIHICLTGLLLAAYIGAVVLARVNGPPALAGVVTAAVAVGLLPLRGRLQAALRRALYGESAEPHRALRRLTSSVDGADDLDGVLDGIAQTTRASMRARWVAVEFEGHQTRSGAERRDDDLVRERVLDAGWGNLGTLRVGLAPGRAFGEAESALFDDLAGHGSRAARLVRLNEQLATARQRLVQGREDERSRLRRTLHDDLGPILAGLTMQLGSLPDLVREDSDVATIRMARLEEEARTALDRMRAISRDLRPPVLDELGLAAAVRDVGSRVGVDVVVLDEVPRDLPAAVEVAAYRVTVEAVVNAGRHAGVDSVAVSVRLSGGRLDLEVTDHGRGTNGAAPGVGIHAMRERAQELGGSLQLTPVPGGGTRVHLSVPVAADRAAR